MTDAINSHSRRMHNAQKKKKADRDGYDQFWAALETATPLDDPRVKALVDLLKEARDDIETYVDADWPENLRAQYPSYLSKWERDMELCRRIDAALSALEENK